MKIIAILHRSAGNESVGDMWRETKVFEDTTPVVDIFKWANLAVDGYDDTLPSFKGHLEITIAHE